MLKITNLHAEADGKEILKGINLEVKAGEIHAIMGPNGSGKSTLSAVLAGDPRFSKTQGEILFEGRSIDGLGPDERSHAGLFLSFQYPVEIPGVSVNNFIKAAVNEKRKAQGVGEIPPRELLDLIKKQADLVELDTKFLSRSLNEGFSGGEKKRSEIFQMAMLDPKLAILDETDSGLDIDALRIVAGGVNKLMSPQKAIILITHYQRLLDYIIPDYVHVLYKGKIIHSGKKELALELEQKGYDWLTKAL